MCDHAIGAGIAFGLAVLMVLSFGVFVIMALWGLGALCYGAYERIIGAIAWERELRRVARIQAILEAKDSQQWDTFVRVRGYDPRQD